MGVLPGAIVKMRAETRYGDSINGLSGSLLPNNTASLFPLTDDLDDTVPFTITTLSYMQFLSSKLALTLGKFDTLDGDGNEFASGRGTSQFMDANFVFNASMALRLPYSAVGGGVVWMPVMGKDGGITVTSLLFTTKDSSTTTGLDNFDDGLTWSTEANFQYRLFDKKLPGGQNVSFLYSFDQDFARIGSRSVLARLIGLAASSEDETWALSWSGWQYLCVHDDSDETPIVLTNGMPDRQGFGVFARAGIADQDTNPIEWSVSGGIGGRGCFGRKHDMYGVGYYYSSLQSSLFTEAIGLQDHAQGMEAFYSFAITAAAHFTIDAQWIDSILPNVDDALVLGGRLRLVF